jgi:hypothetical protein
LRDLLRNKSSNVRAVAAVSLVKSGDKDPSTVDNLMKCLNDKDRLVREAGCLALGKTMFGSSLPPVVAGGLTSHLRYICLLAHSGIQNILCPVFYFVFRHLVYSILPLSLENVQIKTLVAFPKAQSTAHVMGRGYPLD